MEIEWFVLLRDYPTSQGEYTIKVKVEDQGASRVLSSELDIQLHLTRSKSELTLEGPQFLSEHYIGFINEGEQHGQFVLQVFLRQLIYYGSNYFMVGY